jgi:hypothetical protein
MWCTCRVPRILAIVDDVDMKMMELNFAGLPVALKDSELAAIVAYTHDHQTAQKQGNVYFELNQMLRSRGPTERSSLVSTWGCFMHFMMAGLAKLPDITGVCYRVKDALMKCVV